MSLSRRTVLKYGLAGALLLAAGGSGLALRSTLIRAPKRRLQVFDVRAYSVLAAVADRLMPGGNGFPSATEIEVPEKIDALMASCHPAAAAEVVQLLGLFENALASFLFDQRYRTFTASPAEVQDAVLESWRSSRLSVRRTAYKALHGLVSASYYGSPEVYRLIGYPGPPNFGNVRTPGTPNPANRDAALMMPGDPAVVLRNAPKTDSAVPDSTSSVTPKSAATASEGTP